MSYSLLDQLRLFSPPRFEELCGQLVGNMVAPEPWGHVEGSGGDEGIDIFSGTLDPDERQRRGVPLKIWQVKHFFNGLKAPQRNKIEHSLLRVLQTHNPDSWTLCLPVQLTIDEHQWFSAFKARIEEDWPGLTIELPWLGEEIVRRAVSCTGLVDAYFLAPPSPLSKEVLASLVERLNSFDSVPQLLARSLPARDATDFYNGTVPDWGNVLAGQDARREVCGDIWDFLRERSRQDVGGRIPLALIRGGAMDGKSTLLMRLAVELTRQDYPLVFYYKTGSPLDADQFLALDAPPHSAVIALIDGLMSIDLEEVRNFLERLHRSSVKILIIATVLSSIWGHSSATLENVAEVHEFDLSRLTDLDAEALLDKLGEDPAQLGNLALFPREAQLTMIQKEADRQLGVVLLEAKHNTRFEAFVIREFDRLGTLYGSPLRRACTYVSAFHRFDLGIPVALLKRLLPQLHVEDDLLRVTLGFVKLTKSAESLVTRHPCWADVIFQHVAADDRAEKSWLCEILAQAQADGIEDKACIRMLKGLSQRGAEDLVFVILTSRDWISVPLLNLLASIQRRRGLFEDASLVLRKALDINPNEARLWIALAQVKAELGELGDLDQEYSARWLFKRSTEFEGDPHPVYSWHAWAVMEAQSGEVGYQDASQPYTARWLFKRATEIEPQVPHSWAAWAQLEVERGNLGDLKDRNKRKPGAREIFRRAVHESSHPALWRQWAMLETKLENWGTSFYDPFTVRWLYWHLLRVDPNNSVSWRAWAIIESEAGNVGPYREEWTPLSDGWFTARWMFWRGTSVNPRDAGTWQAWGMLEKAQKNWGNVDKPSPYTARWLFRRATEANPNMPHTWNGWAALEEEAMRWEEAGRLFERVGDVETKPIMKAIGYFKGARAMERAKLPVEHERLLRKVLAIDPDNLRANVFLGRFLGVQKKWREAEQYFQRVLGRDPINTLGLLWFSEMQAAREKEAENWEEAERFYLEAADRQKSPKKKSQMLFEAAISAAQSQRKLDHKRHLQAAISVDPRNVYALAQLGLTLSREGHSEEALDYLERAAKLDPANETVRSWLAEISRRVKGMASTDKATRGNLDPPSS